MAYGGEGFGVYSLGNKKTKISIVAAIKSVPQKGNAESTEANGPGGREGRQRAVRVFAPARRGMASVKRLTRSPCPPRLSPSAPPHPEMLLVDKHHVLFSFESQHRAELSIQCKQEINAHHG